MEDTRSIRLWRTCCFICNQTLKDEINHILSTTYIVIVVYMEIAMSPGLGFLSDSSPPSPSLRLFFHPYLHLLMCLQPMHERTLWNVPVVTPQDFLSWCCGSKKQKRPCRITMLVLTTCHRLFFDLGQVNAHLCNCIHLLLKLHFGMRPQWEIFRKILVQRRTSTGNSTGQCSLSSHLEKRLQHHQPKANLS